LPFFPPFVPDSDPASTGPRWSKWVKRFENFLTAMNATEPKRKRALLLHYIGEVAYDIFDTLHETGEDYDTAIEKRSGYFTPKKNIDYEVYVFRQEKQRTGETLDQYATRLRKLASTCEFIDLNKELKSQIILGCVSSRLRRRALRESTLTLGQLLSHGGAMETAEKQATNIEQTLNKRTTIPMKLIALNDNNRFNSVYINKVLAKRIAHEDASIVETTILIYMEYARQKGKPVDCVRK
jgi:hypothetical protein